MMQFFAKESVQGTKVAGVLTKRELAPFRPSASGDDLHKTQPFAVSAAPGFGYLLFEIVTAGNILSPHLLVVHSSEPKVGSTVAKDEQVVFKLGRAEHCQIQVNQNTISRIQCSLIWWP